MKKLLDMSHVEARNFFMKSKSYCSIDLPSYFDFAPILKKTNVFYTIPRLDVSGRFPCENVYRNPCIYQCIETSVAGWVSSHRATMIDE